MHIVNVVSFLFPHTKTFRNCRQRLFTRSMTSHPAAVMAASVFPPILIVKLLNAV